MDNSSFTQLYDGDGGNAQVEFIMEAETGWEQLMDDPQRHRTRGGSKYDYMKSLMPKLGGQAKKNLSDYLKKWDWKNPKKGSIGATAVDPPPTRSLRRCCRDECCYSPIFRPIESVGATALPSISVQVMKCSHTEFVPPERGDWHQEGWLPTLLSFLLKTDTDC